MGSPVKQHTLAEAASFSVRRSIFVKHPVMVSHALRNVIKNPTRQIRNGAESRSAETYKCANEAVCLTCENAP